MDEMDYHLETAIRDAPESLREDLGSLKRTLGRVNQSVSLPSGTRGKESEGLFGDPEQSGVSSVSNSLLSLTNYTSTSEAVLTKYGHLIPLFQGHNGAFSRHQLTIFLRHLQAAQFLQPDYYL